MDSSKSTGKLTAARIDDSDTYRQVKSVTSQIENTLCEKAKAQGQGDPGRATFLKGKADEMKSVRDFLSRHFDLVTQKYY